MTVLRKSSLTQSATGADNDQAETLLVGVLVEESAPNEVLAVLVERSQLRGRHPLRVLTSREPKPPLSHDVSAESAQSGGLAIAKLAQSDVADATATEAAAEVLVVTDLNVDGQSVDLTGVTEARVQVGSGSTIDVTARLASVDHGTPTDQRMRGRTTAHSLTAKIVESARTVVLTIVLTGVAHDVTIASADAQAFSAGAMATQVVDNLGIASRALKDQT